MKKTFFAALCASLILAACSDKNADNPTAASAASAAATDVCANPALNDTVKAQASVHFETIRQYTQEPNLYDEVKLLSIFKQLDFQVSDAKTDKQACQAQIRITVPASVWDLATANAPLAQQNAPKDIVQSNTSAGNIRFDGQNLTLPLNYVAQKQNGFDIATNDENLKSAMRLLAQALAPYGIKDTVVYQGKSMSREQALDLIKNPKPIPAAASEAVPPAKVEEIAPIGDEVPEPPRPEQIKASEPNSNAPEVLQPTAPTKSNVSENEVNQAREANETATQSIKSAWRNIPANIQESLVEEQRNWESKKRQNCRNAGAKGSDAAEIQYLQIQCDTRLTREREQYLKGFSIE